MEKIHSWYLRDRIDYLKLPPLQKQVLAIICKHRNEETGRVYLSNERIMFMTGYSERSVRNATRALVRKGFIDRTWRRGCKVTIYTPSVDFIFQQAAVREQALVGMLNARQPGRPRKVSKPPAIETGGNEYQGQLLPPEPIGSKNRKDKQAEDEYAGQLGRTSLPANVVEPEVKELSQHSDILEAMQIYEDWMKYNPLPAKALTSQEVIPPITPASSQREEEPEGKPMITFPEPIKNTMPANAVALEEVKSTPSSPPLPNGKGRQEGKPAIPPGWFFTEYLGSIYLADNRHNNRGKGQTPEEAIDDWHHRKAA